MIKRSGLIVLGLAVMPLAVAPAMGQNLLTNGDFETGNLTGWTPWVVTSIDNNGAGSGGWIWGPTPPQFGSYHYRAGEQSNPNLPNGPCDGGIYQQVTGLTPGGTYTLSFKWAGGDNGHCLHEVGVKDGSTATFNSAPGSPVYIAGSGVQINNLNGGWDWANLHLTFTAPSNTALVYVKTKGGPYWDYNATFCDDFSLVAGTPTSYQHRLIAMSPAYWRGTTGVVRASIKGFDFGMPSLSDVTVWLTQGANTYPGTVNCVNTDGTLLTVTFDLTGASPPPSLGAMNLVVRKTGHADQTLTNAFTLISATAPTIQNGNFEGGATSGIPNNWTKYSGVNQQTVTGSCDGFGDQPSPCVHGGSNIYREEAIGNQTGGIYQVLNQLVSGETLNLSWYWSCYDDSSTDATHMVAVHAGNWTGTNEPSGNITNGNLTVGPGATSPPGANVSFNWQQGQFSFVVPAFTSQVTIFTRTKATAGNLASRYDDFAISVVPPACPNQHVPECAAWVPNPDVYSGIDLTVNGTLLGNIDGTDGVHLVHETGEFSVAPTTYSVVGGVLSAHFDFLPDGIRSGTYNLVTTQTGCVAQTLPSVFTYSCPGIVFDTISIPGMYSTDPIPPDTAPVNNRLQKPIGQGQTTLTATITGENLDLLQSVRLYQPIDEMYLGHGDPAADLAAAASLHPDSPEANRTINGVITAQSATSLTVEFDFADAQVSTEFLAQMDNPFQQLWHRLPYRLEGTRSGVWCGGPTPLQNAVMLDPPASEKISTALLNGNFDLGPSDPSWVFTDGNQSFGIQDSSVWSLYPRSAPYYAGKHTEGAVTDNHFEQAIDLFSGPGQYDLVLTFWVQMLNHQLHGDTSRVTATIVADAETATPYSKAVTFESEHEWGWSPSWLQASVDFSYEVTTSLKVMFDLHTTYGQYAVGDPPVQYYWGNTLIDDVVLYSAVEGCHDLFADADGDEDVDQADFAVLQRCFEVLPVEGYCRCLDRDDVEGITQADVALFEACATGPGITFVPAGCTP